MILSKQAIEQGHSERGGLNRQQLAILGVAWPPKNGWQSRVIGREITVRDYDEFLRLKSQTVRPRRERKTPVRTDLPFEAGTCPKLQTVIASFWLYVSRLDAKQVAKIKPVLAYMLRKVLSIKDETL
jgi:hypothetical protein